jgi:hypothetical protein
MALHESSLLPLVRPYLALDGDVGRNLPDACSFAAQRPTCVAQVAALLDADYLLRDPRPGKDQEILRFSE